MSDLAQDPIRHTSMGIAFLGHTLVLKPLGLYSPQMQPPFPWPGTARTGLALFSLP